ncbi:MAG: PHP domain-containing protein [Clostridia bacterium]|nr:PHP domain-containing protein [Clostridia bacterium]
MKRYNMHTHTVFCDGRNTPEEMIAQAEELGFVSLGFSSHASQTMNSFWGLRDEPGYIERIRALAAQNDRIRIHLGVELDTVAHCEREKYDYILGGIHYFYRGEEGYPIDHSPEDTRLGADRIYGGDMMAACEGYYRTMIDMMENMKPDIVAHYDLMTKCNEDGLLIDEDNPRYRKAAIGALEAVKAADALLEVNTGAMARGFRTRPYPAPFLLKEWKRMGGRIILGSDCHRSELLDYGFDMAVEYARAAGFTKISRLGGFGEELFVEEDL